MKVIENEIEKMKEKERVWEKEKKGAMLVRAWN